MTTKIRRRRVSVLELGLRGRLEGQAGSVDGLMMNIIINVFPCAPASIHLRKEVSTGTQIPTLWKSSRTMPAEVPRKLHIPELRNIPEIRLGVLVSM